MLNKVKFQEEGQRLPERHQQLAWLEQQQVLVSPTREAVAGWSASQDHGSGGGWQGWGPAHPGRVPPGMVRWKGMETELQSRQEVFRGDLLLAALGRRSDRNATESVLVTG